MKHISDKAIVDFSMKYGVDYVDQGLIKRFRDWLNEDVDLKSCGIEVNNPSRFIDKSNNLIKFTRLELYEVDE